MTSNDQRIESQHPVRIQTHANTSNRKTFINDIRPYPINAPSDKFVPKSVYNSAGGTSEMPTIAAKPKIPIILAKPAEKSEVHKDNESAFFDTRSVNSQSPGLPENPPVDQPRVITSRLARSNNTSSGASSPARKETLTNSTRKPPPNEVGDRRPRTQAAPTLSEKLKLSVSIDKPVKIIDEYLKWTENANNLQLSAEQSDFLVIGVIGRQGAGKSSVLTSLASGGLPGAAVKGTTAGGATAFKTIGGYPRFRAHRFREHAMHETAGVDLAVTRDRLVLLDCQPVLSTSLLDVYSRMEPRVTSSADQPLAENTAEMHSLQLGAWLLSVCHVVLVVAEQADSVAELVRFLHLAHMLKPANHRGTEMLTDGFGGGRRKGACPGNEPHIVFVLNKAEEGDLAPEAVKTSTAVLHSMLRHSKLNAFSGLDMSWTDCGVRRAIRAAHKDTMSGPAVNLWVLPQYPDGSGGGKRERVSHSEATRRLRSRLLALPKPFLTPHHSEKQWLMQCQKTWEMVRKSPIISEYCQLLT